jgi:lipid-A-disaccharide synthase-like uncharacterized protein
VPPVFELLGVTGIAISVLAYLPQVLHLTREHCSAGISSRSWAMWLLSSLLIGALALHRHDLVFVLLQISTLTSAAIILSLAQRYRGMVCETHARGYSRQSVTDWPNQPPDSRRGRSVSPGLFDAAPRVDYGVSDRGLAPRRWRADARELESRPDGQTITPRQGSR